MAQKKSLLTLLLLGTIAFTALLAESSDPQHYLLLDSRIVKESENVVLKVGTVEKHPGNPLFGEDKPWEVRFDNLYGNIIYDKQEKIFKCWYSPFINDSSSLGMTLEERVAQKYDTGPNREMAICYATSRDGLTWDKPELELVEFEGSNKNNILIREPHGTGIFKDLPEQDPSRRYKMMTVPGGDWHSGLGVNFSADGIHWGDPVKCQGVDVAGDTHNNAFWAPTLNKYVGITRTWGDMGREVSRIESDDFIHWTPDEVVMTGLDKDHQPYAMPAFYYGGVYLGLLAIFEPSSDRTWTELAWSTDTKKWNRIDPGTPLIPCSEEKLAYDYGCVYACAIPVFTEKGIRLYYGGSDWLHTSWRNSFLCLATLRHDGFAGYEPEEKKKPAKITTTPISYHGQELQITADVAKGGSVKVTILDGAGKKLTRARSITKTVTNGSLKLDKEIDAKQIQLIFTINKAKVYSFNLDDK